MAADRIAPELILVQTFRLRREFGDAVAVRDVSLSVPRGAVYALVGPNGAGKTTLLKMIAGLLEPSRGTARIRGLDVRAHPREIHALLGFLPDFFGLYDEMRVAEYLEYFARAYRIGPSRRGERVDETLEKVGLADHAKSVVGTLSRGLRQRLAIARTLIHDPPLLLLDEPASGLDPEARHELQTLFRQLAKAGKTLVVSSHILTELEDYCTHLAILQQGALIAAGETQAVRSGTGIGRRVRVRALADLAHVGSIVNADPRAAGWETEDGIARFVYSGGEADLAELLKRLIAAGLPITFFGEETGTIQDTYLSLTQVRK